MDFVTLGITILVVACAIALSWALSKHFRMPDYFGKFTLVLLPLLAGLAVVGLRYDQIRLGIDLRGGVILVYEVVGASEQGPGAAEDPNAPKTPAGSLGKADMDKLIEAISRRVNPSGTKEVTIRQFGPREVEIIIPSDPNKEVDQAEVERLKRILGQAGNLEFRILATRMRHGGIIDRATAPAMQDKDQLKGPDGKVQAWWVPIKADQRSHFEHDSTIVTRTRKVRGEDQLQVLVVSDQYNVNGGYLVRASRGNDEQGRWAVNFQFNSAGGKRFGGLTGSHTPDPAFNNQEYRLGIILDNVLYSAPTIRTTIFQNGEITGNFTPQEVDDLVAVLNAGALPASLSKEPISQRLIGPTLGRDTIQKGILSLEISLALVFLSVLVYYRFAGIVACLALAFNGILLLAVMILIHAPFTLPGLAGFALTIGMAVDANVLIYERMREEAARGSGLRMTIRNGFDRALSAILDSNITTLITAAVLWAIGTDQVRGFAVTLFLGIVLSMFTAIFGARVVFDVAERRKWIGAVHMMQAIGETHFNFLSRKALMIGISAVLILIGLVASGLRGRGLFDIDFTGGISVETVFESPQNVGELRDRLEGLQLQDVVVSEVSLQGEQSGHRFVINTSNPEDVTAEDYLKQVKQILRDMEASDARFRLSRNAMTIGSLVPVASPAPAGKPVEKVEQTGPAAPKSQDQGRMGGPAAGRAEWMELSTLLLGQAEAAKENPKPAELPKPAPTKPADPKPGEAKPTEAKSAEAKSAEAKPAEAKPGEAKPAAPGKPAEAAKPAETAKPAEAKLVETKPAAPTKPSEPVKSAEVVKPAEAASPDVVKASLSFAQPMTHDALLEILKDQVSATLGVGRDTVDIALTNQQYQEGSGTPYKSWDVNVKLPSEQAKKLLAGVQAYFDNNPHFPSSDTIGGAVAENTRYRAVMALLASAVFILLYLWVRFQRVAYGLGAVSSLVHDVLVTLAFVATSFWLAKIPLVSTVLGIEPFKINLVMMAAFLTIAGYSLNDTIVIFDRIREVRGKAPAVTEDMINLSINQTLGRTLLTGLTSMMVIVILYILGGPTIHGFAFAMIIGVVTGTYSSIYIASPFLLWLSRTKETPQQRARSLQK